MLSRKCPLHLVLLFTLILPIKPLFAQSQMNVKNVIAQIDTFYNHLPGEKLYMQFDKPYYAAGDTIWFKGYLFNSTLYYSPLSSRLYVELLNDSNRVVKRMAVPVAFGITWGNIDLSDVKEGSYSIRAYTGWMRNFGPESFFYHSFYVASPQTQSWLISSNSDLAQTGTENTIKTTLRITGADGRPVSLEDVQLKAMDGKKTLYRGTAKTNEEGVLNTSFPLSDKTRLKNLSLVAEDKLKHSYVVPVELNRPQDIDVQFMPESGYMIAGIPSHVGFKAIGEDGKGVDISGQIVDGTTGQQIATFQSFYKGMGSVELLPEAGQTYAAKVTLPGGRSKEIPLPAVKKSGSMLHIRNTESRDSIDVSVVLTDDLVNQNKPLFLVGMAREIVCFAATLPAGRSTLSAHVAKNLFPTGIAHFTLLDADKQPLNERLTFINHHDNLKIDIATLQKNYSPRDSVPLKISIRDNAGSPVVGSFSVAVTDDGQVKASTSENILTHLLLTADLKGFIEAPEYYFSGQKDSWLALDALLLTQGWTGYDWKKINTVPTPAYTPEYAYMVRGKVSNLFNKPLAKADVTLLSKGKFTFVRDTVTNAAGIFNFDNLGQIDSTTFILEARNKNHKVVNAGISIDEVTSPDAKNLSLPIIAPWYVNADQTVLNYMKSNTSYHKELEKAQYGTTGHLLKQVTIKDQAIVKGSANLNGAGNADQTIDEQTIVQAGKMTLFDLLQQKVTGFRLGFKRKSSSQDFFVKDKTVRFVFDGVDLNRYYVPTSDQPDDYYFYIKQYLDYFTAEDIKGIEVLYSSRYNARYNSHNLTVDEQMNINPAGPRGSDNVYLEITTRAGSGPYVKKATGIYVYKPMPITFPKQFYRPRYAVKNSNARFTDLRSTIHWQPNVVTDKNGEATLSFYAADKPATYTVIMEGTDLKGNLGYQTHQITIGRNTTP